MEGRVRIWIKVSVDSNNSRENMTYRKESSPPRPRVAGVEKELPRFHRFARYPTELDMELDREWEPS